MNRHITKGNALGLALLRAFGYDSELRRVKSFAIYWRADSAPLIRVTEYATVEQEEVAVEVLTEAEIP